MYLLLDYISNTKTGDVIEYIDICFPYNKPYKLDMQCIETYTNLPDKNL